MDLTMNTCKTCFKCNETKSIKSFYKHPATSDGYLNKCKECAKLDVRANRKTNIEFYRKYDRERGNRQQKGYIKKYREDYPIKYKATNALNNAIRDNKITKKPCEICGEKQRIHGHHDDYSKPLSVRWLCSAHHAQWHAKNGEGGNAK